MRAVIQRVTQASCTVDGVCTGEIKQGLLVLLGIEEDDTDSETEWVAHKLVNLRIFSDEAGLMNKSIQDIAGNILLISQFTLIAQTRKGNRPSFIRAAKPNKAEQLYQTMSERLSALLNKQVQMGVFGADMEIDLCNDGPVTIILDTKE
ncbi:D-aminoacyl-tRNA deacylase [Sphingobacterium gobiense]|uniref:D-aminoacyl-tRNA deacylase n=1 Tax=Sphingobacterium gobiense TaxID=1382456 RepID=A0A2S9JEQ2_9SPHI|nr:D-aminoacyl-tRNA deacylase [Sphingobacterium gobiense]PRD51369.1 D-tyrosyl-tRNA(Tyr) deacylase [Sphingobacterium gobiense]